MALFRRRTSPGRPPSEAVPAGVPFTRTDRERFAPDGTFLVSDTGGALLRFDDRGTFLGSFAEDAALGFPEEAFGGAIDAAGNVFLADYEGNRVHVLGSDGTLRASWGTAGAAPGQFAGPSYLALGAPGSLYISDEGHNRVQIFRLMPLLGPEAGAALES